MGSRTEIQQEAQQQTEYDKGQQKVNLESLGDLSSQAVMPRVQQIAARIVPSSEQLCRELRVNDPMNCAYKISITEGQKNAQGIAQPDTSLNAYADGTSVHVSPAMVRFAAQDHELAFILSHEFAHNIMRHVAGKQRNAMLGTLLGVAADMAAASQGYDSQGQFGKIGMGIGANAYSPAFESEADYIGLYLLARSGYNYHDAPAFWRRMSVENPQAIYTGSTHPSNAERYVNMNKTIAEIDRKKASNLPLVPEFKER
jgi:predicted Zn-dependent protease